MIRAVIIDDEASARKVLSSLLSNFLEGVEVIGEADTALSGKKLIENLKPDLVFLDVDMPAGNGFTLLSSFEQIDFSVIFVTAYSEYAIKAIKFSALDYLLKPVDLEELKRALERYKGLKTSEKHGEIYFLPGNMGQLWQQNAKITLPTSGGFKVVALKEIIFLQASGSYTEFHFLSGRPVIVGKNLKHFEQKLEQLGLLRVHDSYIVNLHHVEEYLRGRGGTLKMVNGAEVSVSRNKKDILLARLKSR